MTYKQLLLQNTFPTRQSTERTEPGELEMWENVIATLNNNTKTNVFLISAGLHGTGSGRASRPASRSSTPDTGYLDPRNNVSTTYSRGSSSRSSSRAGHDQEDDDAGQ